MSIFWEPYIICLCVFRNGAPDFVDLYFLRHEPPPPACSVTLLAAGCVCVRARVVSAPFQYTEAPLVARAAFCPSLPPSPSLCICPSGFPPPRN